MAVIEISKIQVRRGEELQTGIPRLDPGEFAWAQDTEHLYIGKRIVEGANSDENTRILTEADINDFLTLALSTATGGVYKYRNGEVHITSLPTTVADKLDTLVSITDFGVTPSSDPIDIYTELNAAVDNIFNNSFPDDARRTLLIPAGVYYVSDTVVLPPNTSLRGEGPGLTTLVLSNSINPLFKTEDSAGNLFEDPAFMSSGAFGPQNIQISNLTLAHKKELTNNQPLLSLDNVDTAVLSNVEFTSTGTSTVRNYGLGLEIRGTRISGVEQAKNISLHNCEFSAMNRGMSSTGTVINVTVNNSIFRDLNQGINLSTGTVSAEPPKSFVISNSRFEKISREAIFVGTATSATNHISHQNMFRHVGNGLSVGGPNDDDTPTSQTSPVVAYYSQGNRSHNDNFNRRDVAEYQSGSFYYNPLIAGRGTADSGQTRTVTVAASSGSNYIVKLPLTGIDQSVTMRYSMYDATNYSRKGRLIINIVGADGSATISDYYDYSYISAVIDPTFDIDISMVANGYIMLYCNNNSYPSDLTFEFQTDILV
jgi:hypothetical protein